MDTDRTAQINAALDLIADGSSVRTACLQSGIDKGTFLRLVDGDLYEKARDACADAHFQDMVDDELACRDGKIDPQAFKAILDSKKWRLARMKPKIYGDRTAVEHSGADGGPLSITVVRFGDVDPQEPPCLLQ